MDLASFAQPSVPVLGLILLGANLSRLSMKGLPKGFWKSAVLMAVLKLIVGKIYGFSVFAILDFLRYIGRSVYRMKYVWGETWSRCNEVT